MDGSYIADPEKLATVSTTVLTVLDRPEAEPAPPGCSSRRTGERTSRTLMVTFFPQGERTMMQTYRQARPSAQQTKAKTLAASLAKLIAGLSLRPGHRRTFPHDSRNVSAEHVSGDHDAE